MCGIIFNEVICMRVQINLNDELVKKIDEYAAAIGQNRSSVCAMWIGQAALGIEKATQTLEKMGVDVAKALAEDKRRNESK